MYSSLTSAQYLSSEMCHRTGLQWELKRGNLNAAELIQHCDVSTGEHCVFVCVWESLQIQL